MRVAANEEDVTHSVHMWHNGVFVRDARGLCLLYDTFIVAIVPNKYVR